MKSKSFDLKKVSVEKIAHNKTFDFIGFYKSTAETNNTNNEKCISNDISKDILSKESPRAKAESLKCPRTPNKNKTKKNDPVSISQIDIDGSSINCSVDGSTPLNSSKITSTPNCVAKSATQTRKVKSIMKNTSGTDEHLKDTESPAKHNSKKRNKSVSFMLDDNEEIAVKKIKPDDSKNVSEKSKFFKTSSLKKFNKVHHLEKENKSDIKQNVKRLTKSKAKLRKEINEDTNLAMDTNVDLENTTEKSETKKIYKNSKNVKKQADKCETVTTLENQSGVEQSVETKAKKIKKKKPLVKPHIDEGEPATKARKTEMKPDIIAEDLENLNIGDNAHTLSNLLDEMTVADKNKRKKLKSKLKGKNSPTTESPIETEEEKEKLKWKKRKWNKDKKGDMDTESLNTSIIIENLPISTVLTYRKILSDSFEKYGSIKKIGIAQVYPADESKAVFTTTIHFGSDGAATQALQENGSLLAGSRIRVTRPLPATETTVVLRTYAELNEQNVTSLFTGTGKIRNIRHLVKGKKAMSTAFVEFDGPESVQRAIKKCKDSKIGSKKVHIAKYEIRAPKKKSKLDEGKDETNISDNEG